MLVSLAWLVYIYRKKILIFSCYACLALVISEQRGPSLSRGVRRPRSFPVRCPRQISVGFSSVPSSLCYPLEPSPVLRTVRGRSHRSVHICLCLCTSYHIFRRLFGAMRQRHLLLHLLDKKEATYALCIRISFNEHRLTSFPG